VLMPFDSKFDDIYKFGIKKACEDCGAYCERVDEQIFVESMIERIYNQISKADIIIADMTGRNANVFYEVGYAHALGKTVIMLTQEADDIPFDLKHYQHIIYGSSIAKLQDDLKPKIDFYINNPEHGDDPYIFPLDLYINGLDLSKGLDPFEIHDIEGMVISLTIHNSSLRIIQEESLKMYLVYGKCWTLKDPLGYMPINMPDGTIMSQIYSVEELLPDMYTAVRVELARSRLIGSVTRRSIDPSVTFRIYGPHGIRDFPISVFNAPPSSNA
jgi:hypothetical protein